MFLPTRMVKGDNSKNKRQWKWLVNIKFKFMVVSHARSLFPLWWTKAFLIIDYAAVYYIISSHVLHFSFSLHHYCHYYYYLVFVQQKSNKVQTPYASAVCVLLISHDTHRKMKRRKISLSIIEGRICMKFYSMTFRSWYALLFWWKFYQNCFKELKMLRANLFHVAKVSKPMNYEMRSRSFSCNK